MTTNITAEQARAKQRDTRLARFYERSSRAEDLAAPGVPGTLPPDNLVPVDQLDNGLDIAGASPSAQGSGKASYTVTQGGADYSPAVEALVPIDLGAP